MHHMSHLPSRIRRRIPAAAPPRHGAHWRAKSLRVGTARRGQRPERAVVLCTLPCDFLATTPCPPARGEPARQRGHGQGGRKPDRRAGREVRLLPGSGRRRHGTQGTHVEAAPQRKPEVCYKSTQRRHRLRRRA